MAARAAVERPRWGSKMPIAYRAGQTSAAAQCLLYGQEFCSMPPQGNALPVILTGP